MLIAVRYVLPAVVVIAGFLVMAIGGDTNAYEGGGAIVGAGLSIALLNILFRIGVQGEEEREREDYARVFFDEHGHWPDEDRPA